MELWPAVARTLRLASTDVDVHSLCQVGRFDQWTALYCCHPAAPLGVWQCRHSLVTDDSEAAGSTTAQRDQHIKILLCSREQGTNTRHLYKRPGDALSVFILCIVRMWHVTRKQKHSFNAKVPSSFDKTDGTAASLPIPSAVVRLATSCLSSLSSYVSLPGFIAAKKKLIGAGIQFSFMNCFVYELKKGWLFWFFLVLAKWISKFSELKS